MNIAEKIIEKFGGQTAVAKLIGKTQGAVFHWAKAGVIPAKWHSRLMELARDKGIELQSSEFIDIPGADLKPSKMKIPEARWPGELSLGEATLPCYVLDDGRRIISRNAATNVLTDGKGGGNLESYIKVDALHKYLPIEELPGQLIEFNMPGVVNKKAQGMLAETFLEICRAYQKALQENTLETDRQREIALKATMFLAACAKVGLLALIDEATGYQYERAQDALQMKLKLFLEEEMRKWEKTFPDELWKEFGRLTNWKGTVQQRPKYWGKLVMELVYGYLDPDVARWLKENAPKPLHGQNYHQWLSSQYGLKRLVEHIWMLVGMASACSSMSELKQKMAEKYGRQAVQLTLYLPPPIGRN